jgi:two-component system phosphate regulon sensor histidine kinase PhoR
MALLKHMRRAFSGDRCEMDIERSDRAYRVFFSPVTDSGAIILFLDTTEKTRAERLRREFSANVSHELKTPLTSISGYAEMLVSGMAEESDKPAFIGKIKDETTRLTALVEDIMMISELDEGRGPESFEDVNIAAVAADAADALSLKADESGVSIAIEGENAIFKANRVLIYEMFYNLIDNAVKYNRHGGNVRISTVKDGDGIIVSISDTGIGIPRDAQVRVFERFYRVDKSRSRKTGGTGLGLAIVKHIAMVHNAKIALNSKLNEGTTVSVAFNTNLKSGT